MLFDGSGSMSSVGNVCLGSTDSPVCPLAAARVRAMISGAASDDMLRSGVDWASNGELDRDRQVWCGCSVEPNGRLLSGKSNGGRKREDI